jgi:HAD superfamily phosphatase (TIGR01668 family)
MTAQNEPDPSSDAPTPSEAAKKPTLPELLETEIIQAIDSRVTQSDASGVPYATPTGHPPRHGLLIFCPHRLVETVWQIKPEELRQLSIEGVILDLDNTLVKWQQEDMTEEVETWLQSVQELDIRLCILSNSLLGSRSERIAAKLNSPFVRHARKPSRSGFDKSMIAMGTVPATTAVVGDQMFTDILGGNRAGIYTIMVKPIHPREFPYTRYVSRPPEKLLLNYFRKRGKL